MKHPAKKGLVALALVAALVASVLATAGSAATPAKKKLKGTPVSIGSIYPINATAVNFPDLQYMAQIAVAKVNAHGGIHGRPLAWSNCDDKGDPAVAATCADTMINQKKVLAVINQVGLQTGVPWPLMKANNVINWFDIPITPDDGTSPLSYPAGLGIYAHQNVGILVKSGEMKKVRCLAGDSAFAPLICGFAKAALAAQGVTDFDIITYPLTATTYGPQAAKAVADKPDGIVIVGADTTTVGVVQALVDAGWKGPILEPSTSVGSKTLAVASQAGLDLRVSGAWGLDPKVFPGRKQMLKDVKKYAKKVGAPAGFDQISDNAIGMYLGVTTFAEIMNKLPTVSVADFQTYVSQHPITTGMSAPLDWTKPGPISSGGSALPRIVNVYGTVEKISKGKLVSSSKEFCSGFSGVSCIAKIGG